jgi:hypothetical protein
MPDADPGFSPGPPPEASAFFKAKGLRPAFSWQDVEPEEHAAAFTVAKAMQVEVLTTIKDSLQKAIDEGIPFETWQRNLKPELQRLGWWGRQAVQDPATGETVEAQLGSPRRLKTIYRANIRSARAAGQWERIQRTKRALPFLEYQLGPSERHRPEHAAKAGMILPVDDPAWAAWFPPNGWGCKCWVRQITRRQAQEQGVDDSPEMPVRTWTNARTGEEREVPVGIDPGWETNPGATRLKNLERHLSGTLDSADPAVARAAARDMAGSWYARRLVEGRGTGTVPVAILPDDLVAALGSRTRVVGYSAATVERHQHHPEIAPDVMPWLADLIEDGLVFQEAGRPGALLLFAELDGKWFKMVLKKTGTGEAVFVTTWHRVGAQEVSKAQSKHRMVRGAPGRS